MDEMKEMREHDMMDEKVYVCPMHPEETSDKPGKCPICGMDLELMGESEESEMQEAFFNIPHIAEQE